MNELKDIWMNTNYQVTEDGRVWSKKRKIWLKLMVDRDGYLRVNLGDKLRDIAVHRIVFEAFYRRLQPNEHAHHINQIRNDNRAINIVAKDSSEHNRIHKQGNKNALGHKWILVGEEKERISRLRSQEMKRVWAQRKRLKHESKEG